jgi:hypothetical protein
MMTSTQQPVEGSHDSIFADFASLLVARAQGTWQQQDQQHAMRSF